MSRWIDIRRRHKNEPIKFKIWGTSDATIVFIGTYTILVYYPKWLINRKLRRSGDE